MKKSFLKQILAVAISAVVLFSTISVTCVYGASVIETPNNQLQTIYLDNNGTNKWLTESWRGANILPNTSWTTSDLSQYYENGYVNFKVRNTNSGTATFWVGLASRYHGERHSIYWTDMEKYKGQMIADSNWRSYSLRIKEVVDAFPESDFTLKGFWLIAISAATEGCVLEFCDVTISSTDDERQYPFIKLILKAK